MERRARAAQNILSVQSTNKLEPVDEGDATEGGPLPEAKALSPKFISLKMEQRSLSSTRRWVA